MWAGAEMQGMRTKQISENILDYLKQCKGKPPRAIDISNALRLDGQERKKIHKVLNRMVDSGEIAELRHNQYAVALPATGGSTATGRIDIARSGDGFLETGDGHADIRIMEKNLGTALPGDLVEVNVPSGGRGGRRMAEPAVTRVVERAHGHIVGTMKTTGRGLFVVPIDPAYSRWFKVSEANGASIDDRVVIAFVKWDSRGDDPEGRIVEVLGPSNVASIDTLTIIRHYNYQDGFQPDVLQECDSAAVFPTDTARRLDLRQKFIFTIDPVTAKDFDDALSLDVDRDGNRVLGVHIADVSFFVRPGGALDIEALKRGNSVYFPDKVLPMLPQKLSNGVCSLVPDEDRLAFSVFITVDGSGKVLRSTFARSIMRSRLRLTYEQAMLVIDTPEGQACRRAGVDTQAVRLIKDIGRLAQQFRYRRFAAGAIDLELPEYEIVLKPDGSVSDVRQVPYDQSHQLVEECMVAANEAVDLELSNRGVGLIHRIHEPPAEKKIEDLTVKVQEMGFTPGNLRERGNLVRFLRSVEKHPLRAQVQVAVLRSMCKAVYSASPKGHFGLSKKFYAHFTSPIRRYPDLVVHRILGAILESKTTPYRMQDLSRISDLCSETEQQAAEAERALLEIKKYRFLAQDVASRKHSVYDAVVVRIMDFGMFVELKELQISGLVHISTMGRKPGASRSARPKRSAQGALQGGNSTFRAGSNVRVRVTKVDFDNRQIDFSLV